MVDRYLPPGLPTDRVVARIGLISDTHMPARCAELPPTVFEVLRGVDVVLHAGDVGELWVLDRLSAIAPVIAVHGNDSTPDEARELPYQQIVAAGGQRILLTHAHYPDRAEEMESRKDDRWRPKLARRAAMGTRAGARIVVFGHTHIPMAVEHDGVLLVNPGALGPPNPASRQRVQSVAILSIREDGTPFATHSDLANPAIPFVPHVDWDAGFRAALNAMTDSILAPDLTAEFPAIMALMRNIAPDAGEAAYFRVARRCWSGKQSIITRDDLRAEIEHDTAIPADAKARIIAALRECPLS